MPLTFLDQVSFPHRLPAPYRPSMLRVVNLFTWPVAVQPDGLHAKQWAA